MSSSLPLCIHGTVGLAFEPCGSMVGAGRRAPDSGLAAVSDDAAARVSGKYFYHLLPARTNSASAM
jgi:hypothetical protein